MVGKHLSSTNRVNDKTAHILDDGVDARKFDNASPASGTLNDRQLKLFGFALYVVPSQPSESTWEVITITSSSSGSSMPKKLRRFSAVRIP